MIVLEKTLLYHKRMSHQLVDYREYRRGEEKTYVTTIDGWKIGESTYMKMSKNEFKKKMFF